MESADAGQAALCPGATVAGGLKEPLPVIRTPERQDVSKSLDAVDQLRMQGGPGDDHPFPCPACEVVR